MANEKTTVTPVLSSKVGYLTDIRDQVMTLFRFIIMNPGSTSSLWEKDLISFRKLAAQYEGDRDFLVNTLNEKVTRVLNDMFHDYSFQGEFRAENYDEDEGTGRYKVVFSILLVKNIVVGGTVTPDNMEEAIPAVISGTVTVDKPTNNIILKYDRTLDTNSFLLK